MSHRPSSSAPASGKKASPARRAALGVLLSAETDPAALPAALRLSPEDRRLAERICFGTLQNERYLDRILDRYLKSPIRKLEPRLRALLRLSAYQLLFLDRVPASAVINDAVTLCREGKSAWAAGLVNAVLRKVQSSEECTAIHAIPYGAQSSRSEIPCLSQEYEAQRSEILTIRELPAAVLYSHPDWLFDRLTDAFGEETAVAFMRKNQEVPALRLQINTRRITPEEYLHDLEQSGVPVLSVNGTLGSVLIPQRSVAELPGYDDGLFQVQDDAARTAVRICGIRPDMEILDACAAPGGKSVAAVLDGAVPERILACDLKEARLARCRENFRRLGLEIRTLCEDASVSDCSCRETYFDLVLADVPCTGTGVIRKHPSIRRRTEEELNALLPLQRRILENLSARVRPGGLLLYSTCSVLREENEDQVEAFLAAHPDFRLEPVSVPGFSCENGMLRSWPQLNDNDGFFAAKLRKV